MASEGFAPAKINLTLHVTGQRADGYHLLDSLVVFADVGDRLWVAPADAVSLDVTGPMAEGVPRDGRNLVVRAAERMGVGARIRLEKHLPAAAGIGGGSSDAATALKALAVMSGRDLPQDLGVSLGADVPVCMLAQAARMQGIGDVVAPVSGLPKLPAVLVNPGVSVSTPEVFKALERRDNAPMPEALPEMRTPVGAARWLATQRNDLEAPAQGCQPVIGTVLDALSGTRGALLARMSGSGATCFALFESSGTAARAAAAIGAAHPGWWVRACVLS